MPLGSDMIMSSLSSDEDSQNQTTSSLDTLSNVVLDQKKLEHYEKLIKQLRPRQVVRDGVKIGRNDPCPCGSGKKYKNCCLSSGKYEKYTTITR